MKTHYCFLKKFNNYFNRKIIKFSDLEDYENSSEDSFIPLDVQGNYLPFDFNPADDVSTEVIVNDVEFHPDYFLLLDPADFGIISRWFVMEQRRNRQGQWIYYLRRDVVADHLESLLDSPFFVQKGMLPETDKFILNDEGMNFNQIKKQENFIKDDTNTAWLVGYIAKNSGGSDINLNIPSANYSKDAVSLSDLATAMGTTEGTLVSLLNFDGAINTYLCFTSYIDIYFGIRYRDAYTGDDYLYRFKFSDNLDYELTDYTDREALSEFLFDSVIGSNTLTSKLNTYFPAAVETYKSSLLSQIPSIVGLTYYFNQAQLNILRQYSGRTIFYNSKYYILQLIESGNTSHRKGAPFVASLYTSLSNIASKTASDVSELSLRATPYYTDFIINGNNIAISLNETSVTGDSNEYIGTISASRTPTMDQEFDIFAIPYEEGLFMKDWSDPDPDNRIEIYNKKEVAIRTAVEAAKTLGKNLYDLQLLPYLPLPIGDGYGAISLNKIPKVSGATAYSTVGVAETTSDTMTVNYPAANGRFAGPPLHPNLAKWYIGFEPTDIGLLSGTTFDSIGTVTFTAGEGIDSITDTVVDSNNIYIEFALTTSGVRPTEDCIISFTLNYTTNQGSPATVIIYCQSSSFSKYTDSGIPEEINDASISLKVLSNAYYMRLCSPNYQGSFDINIGKNNGKIKGFWLYGTYKPYTPYIKVAPLFESLYGENFGDQRGLICSGDFSLPRIIDEWQNYELNNKNYQNIFNREIQNMEFMQYYERRNQLVSGAVGIVGDTVKGAAAGAYVGGGWGAAAGAVIGGGTSAVGYAIDVDTLAKTQRETKQLAIDKFNYQLGNIKALPYTLTNIGAFNINSKIYPFLEIYTPTEEELSAFENKIRWESMTVMRIDTMRNFWRKFDELCYFKAELIRCDDIAENNHMLNAIYEEILKGVYI